MKVCATPGCPTLINATAYKGRCPQCNRDASKARGTREQQGYGAEHRAQRKAWQTRIDNGESVTCWRCKQPITPTDLMHLGHSDDRTHYEGPEHATCNLAAAGRASHG